MAIFNSYVKLPEGIYGFPMFSIDFAAVMVSVWPAWWDRVMDLSSSSFTMEAMWNDHRGLYPNGFYGLYRFIA